MLISSFSVLSSKSRKLKIVSESKGFTLFEVLIVIGIMAILSSFLVGYSRQGNRALVMTSTETKMSNMMSRAKFLSIQTYFQSEADTNEVVCAYGVHIDTDTQEAFIYQDIKDVSIEGCSEDIDDYADYNSSEDIRLTGELSRVILNNTTVKIGDAGDGTTLDYVIFVPPDPLVKINGNVGERGDTGASVVITDGEVKLTITVNDKGQIKTE